VMLMVDSFHAQGFAYMEGSRRKKKGMHRGSGADMVWDGGGWRPCPCIEGCLTSLAPPPRRGAARVGPKAPPTVSI
jgi:hypothetical protein